MLGLEGLKEAEEEAENFLLEVDEMYCEINERQYCNFCGIDLRQEERRTGVCCACQAVQEDPIN